MEAVQKEKDDGQREFMKNTLVEKTLPAVVKYLNEKANARDGYLALDKLSWVDLYFTVLTDALSSALGKADVTAGYPRLQQLRQKVMTDPKIEKWVRFFLNRMLKTNLQAIVSI